MSKLSFVVIGQPSCGHSSQVPTQLHEPGRAGKGLDNRTIEIFQVLEERVDIGLLRPPAIEAGAPKQTATSAAAITRRKKRRIGCSQICGTEVTYCKTTALTSGQRSPLRAATRSDLRMALACHREEFRTARQFSAPAPNRESPAPWSA
jgi:hypothetical protein